jgi:RHS repeat-associated protein
MTDLTGQRTIARDGRTITVEASAGGTYQLDASGRVIGHDGLTLTWGPTGEIDEATRGSRTWSYLYDEAGQRIGKRENGAMVAGYVGAIYLDEQHTVLPVKVHGQLIGTWQLSAGGHRFEPVATDPRGSLLGEDGVANLPTPYGVRAQRPAQAAALDFVERGYDADLGTVRFGVRDYDPKLGQFWSPDPLFLEAIEKCAESPVECNLYGYAKGNPVSWTDPSGLGVVRVLRNLAADAVEAGATLAGGIVGGLAGAVAGGGVASPATSAALAVVGAGLGRGLASAPADWIRGKTPTVTRQLTAMAEGATMEMGGQIFGVALRSLRPPPRAAAVGPEARVAGRAISVDDLSTPPGGRQALAVLTQWTASGGRGLLAQQANLAKTAELIKGLPARIDAIRTGGVTREMAQQWAQFYRQVAAQTPATATAGNPNALPRAQLMQAIADLL